MRHFFAQIVYSMMLSESVVLGKYSRYHSSCAWILCVCRNMENNQSFSGVLFTTNGIQRYIIRDYHNQYHFIIHTQYRVL